MQGGDVVGQQFRYVVLVLDVVGLVQGGDVVGQQFRYVV